MVRFRSRLNRQLYRTDQRSKRVIPIHGHRFAGHPMVFLKPEKQASNEMPYTRASDDEQRGKTTGFSVLTGPDATRPAPPVRKGRRCSVRRGRPPAPKANTAASGMLSSNCRSSEYSRETRRAKWTTPPPTLPRPLADRSRVLRPGAGVRPSRHRGHPATLLVFPPAPPATPPPPPYMLPAGDAETWRRRRCRNARACTERYLRRRLLLSSVTRVIIVWQQQ